LLCGCAIFLERLPESYTDCGCLCDLVCTWGRFYYYNRNCSFFKQVPDIGAYIGLLLIVSGVVVLNLFSKMDVH
jgi:hypothetical protein